MARPLIVRLPRVLTLLMMLLVSQVRAEHHETWIEVRSPHFTVLSNAGEHQGRLTAQQFEEIRAMFEQRYPKLHADSGKANGLSSALKNEDSLKLFLPG